MQYYIYWDELHRARCKTIMKVIGIDIGGEIKFSYGDSAIKMAVPNVIGSATPGGWSELNPNKSWDNNLIYLDGEEEVYIGELARTQSEIKQFILDQGNLTKIGDIFTLIKAFLPIIIKDQDNDLALGIGVPISTSVEKMKELSAQLKGEISVKIKNDATKEIIEKKFNIKQVYVMPESYGTYYGIVSKQEDTTAIDAVVISLDLLTEISTVYEGRLIRSASRNLVNASLFMLSNKIALALQQESGMIINPHAILESIRTNRNQIVISGKTYDIAAIKEHYMRQISVDIVDTLAELLKALPLEAKVEYFIISGEAMDLFWNEIELLMLEKNLLVDFDPTRVIKVKEPTFANAIGFESMVKKKLTAGDVPK